MNPQGRRAVQEEMVFRTWGGKRSGAGRKQVKPRKSEAHRKRPLFSRTVPLHVVVRVDRAVGALRRRHAYKAIRKAMQVVLGMPEFRIVHISIQRTHVHLVV